MRATGEQVSFQEEHASQRDPAAAEEASSEAVVKEKEPVPGDTGNPPKLKGAMDIRHLLVRPPAAAESSVADFLLSLANDERDDEPIIGLSSSTPAAAKVVAVQEGDARPFKCNWPGGCSYTATKRRYVGEHMRTHTGFKPHKCTFPGCGYSAAGTGHLRRHMRVHTGEKPYSCDWPGCAYASSQPTHVTTHKRKHTGDKPYACSEPGCEKLYCSMIKLTFDLPSD